jgi:hypothetical protein
LTCIHGSRFRTANKTGDKARSSGTRAHHHLHADRGILLNRLQQFGVVDNTEQSTVDIDDRQVRQLEMLQQFDDFIFRGHRRYRCRYRACETLQRCVWI